MRVPEQAVFGSSGGAGLALFALLPGLDVLTTELHLGRTLFGNEVTRDWSLASVDLSFLAIGAAFMLWYVRARRAAADRSDDARRSMPSVDAARSC